MSRRRAGAIAAALTLMPLVKILYWAPMGAQRQKSLSSLTDTSNIDYASIEGPRPHDVSTLKYNSKNTFRKYF